VGRREGKKERRREGEKERRREGEKERRREGCAWQRGSDTGKRQTSPTCGNVANGTHQETVSEDACCQNLLSEIKACQ
jgi:hypothetical protein